MNKNKKRESTKTKVDVKDKFAHVFSIDQKPMVESWDKVNQRLSELEKDENSKITKEEQLKKRFSGRERIVCKECATTLDICFPKNRNPYIHHPTNRYKYCRFKDPSRKGTQYSYSQKQIDALDLSMQASLVSHLADMSPLVSELTFLKNNNTVSIKKAGKHKYPTIQFSYNGQLHVFESETKGKTDRKLLSKIKHHTRKGCNLMWLFHDYTHDNYQETIKLMMSSLGLKDITKTNEIARLTPTTVFVYDEEVVSFMCKEKPNELHIKACVSYSEYNKETNKEEEQEYIEIIPISKVEFKSSFGYYDPEIITLDNEKKKVSDLLSIKELDVRAAFKKKREDKVKRKALKIRLRKMVGRPAEREKRRKEKKKARDEKRALEEKQKEILEQAEKQALREAEEKRKNAEKIKKEKAIKERINELVLPKEGAGRWVYRDAEFDAQLFFLLKQDANISNVAFGKTKFGKTNKNIIEFVYKKKGVRYNIALVLMSMTGKVTGFEKRKKRMAENTELYINRTREALKKKRKYPLFLFVFDDLLLNGISCVEEHGREHESSVYRDDYRNGSSYRHKIHARDFSDNYLGILCKLNGDENFFYIARENVFDMFDNGKFTFTCFESTVYDLPNKKVELSDLSFQKKGSVLYYTLYKKKLAASLYEDRIKELRKKVSNFGCCFSDCDEYLIVTFRHALVDYAMILPLYKNSQYEYNDILKNLVGNKYNKRFLIQRTLIFCLSPERTDFDYRTQNTHYQSFCWDKDFVFSVYYTSVKSSGIKVCESKICLFDLKKRPYNDHDENNRDNIQLVHYDTSITYRLNNLVRNSDFVERSNAIRLPFSVCSKQTEIVDFVTKQDGLRCTILFLDVDPFFESNNNKDVERNIKDIARKLLYLSKKTNCDCKIVISLTKYDIYDIELQERVEIITKMIAKAKANKDSFLYMNKHEQAKSIETGKLAIVKKNPADNFSQPVTLSEIIELPSWVL